jgi:hypothetical protein
MDPSFSLPTGRELANRLAEYAGFAREEVDVDDLLEVASGFELFAGRHHLQEELEDIFGCNQDVGPLHHFLAGFAAPLLIVTTNYDTIIERAFRERGREFHVIMTPMEGDARGHILWWAPGAIEPTVYRATQFVPTPEDLPMIYKIHGGFDPAGKWHGCVISEDDYFEIGGRIYESSLLPSIVGAKLQYSSLLFLGYSLRDIHVRHLVSRFRRSSKAQAHYLVSKKLSRFDRARFGGLGVHTYELTIREFLEGLQSTVTEQGAS